MMSCSARTKSSAVAGGAAGPRPARPPPPPPPPGAPARLRQAPPRRGRRCGRRGAGAARARRTATGCAAGAWRALHLHHRIRHVPSADAGGVGVITGHRRDDEATLFGHLRQRRVLHRALERRRRRLVRAVRQDHERQLRVLVPLGRDVDVVRDALGRAREDVGLVLFTLRLVVRGLGIRLREPARSPAWAHVRIAPAASATTVNDFRISTLQ